MVRNLNIALNKDDDIEDSQIPVMWQCISIMIPLSSSLYNSLWMPCSFARVLELSMYAF